MRVKFQTTGCLIYAELNKTERGTRLASRNRIYPWVCHAILYQIEQRGDFEVIWASLMTNIPILLGYRG